MYVEHDAVFLPNGGTYLEKDCVVRLGISVELREVCGGLHRVDELGGDGGGGVAGGGRRGGHCVAGRAPDVGSC